MLLQFNPGSHTGNSKHLVKYRLDGMMTCLQDIHWAERSVAQCMF